MKRRGLWMLLAGLVIGIVAGFGLALWILAPLPEPRQARVLNNVAFQELAAKAGPTKWEVLRDGPISEEGTWYYLGPWKGQSTLLSRHAMARAQLTEADSKEFVKRASEELARIIGDRGAHPGRKTNGVFHHQDGFFADWVEQQYSYGGMQGVAHLSVTGQGDRVTCFLTLVEVRATAESWPVGDIPIFRRASGGP